MANGSKRTLAGRYEIESPVGQGGMAKVFRGTDTVLGRTVAVKVLAPEFARDGQFVERFRREAQAAAALNHTNIVSVFDTGSENGIHFIVMEYLEGRTLKEVLTQEGPLHPERVAEIGEGIANALGAAHQQDLVHRDVKPGNIMLTPQGEVKVMDFGIARVTTGEALTQTATVLGTASYFSPEQAKGESVDARSDIYALGCVLYELLTGEPPFTGDSPVAVAYKHVREEPKRPSQVNPHVPGPLEAVITKALAKNPANRYQTAAEMAQDLARFRQGLPVMATPLLPGAATQVVPRAGGGTAVMTPVEDEEEPEGRKTWLVALIAILVLALLGLAAFFLTRQLTSGAPLVRVPDVVGLSEEDAVQRLEDRGFTVTVTPLPDEADEGTVFEQDPEGRTDAPEGSEVTIKVSTGPEQVVVPNLFGKTVEDARIELENIGLTLGAIERVESDEPQGTIIDQRPRAEREVDPGRAVNVVVSEGDTSRIVPNVSNCIDEDTARERLESQDLEMRVAGEEFSASCPEAGTIVRQNPAAGETVEAGSRVRVWRSRGVPPSPTPTATATASP